MTDPLLPLLAASDPAAPSQNVKYRQGTVLTFNQNTLENTVDVGGAILTNLPVLGVAEAVSLVPGAVVGLLAIESTLGTLTYAILGRLVTPATPAARDAITLLGQSVVTDFVAANESTTSFPFTDLATVGPTVTINVRVSGKLLLFLAATIRVTPPNTALEWGGFMNVDVTGANTLSALSGGLGYGASSPAGLGLYWSFMRMIPLTGLNPGVTKFVAKYAVLNGNPGETAFFKNRSIAVFAL